MFLEIKTTRNETVLLNVKHILYLTEDKEHTIIVDINGCDYLTNERLDNLSLRLAVLLKNQNS